ncbi:MAG: hypothetical protein NTW32_09870 [Chloroflexi bacterium]|nr:hypothetical protein [Chloroflexota bacterium]
MYLKNNSKIQNVVKGKTIYLLGLIVLVEFGYPITAYGITALVIFEILCVSMILAGVIVGRDSIRHMLFLGCTNFVYFAASITYALNPTTSWAVFLTNIALVPYLGMLFWVLGRFLLSVNTITRDVLYAAISIYFLRRALCVAVWHYRCADTGLVS